MTFDAHPIANLFPMVDESELEELARDIRDNGLLEPIVLHEAKILDGRNRAAACERAGVAPRFTEWRGEGGTPLRFVLSHNLHRRHLTTAQRAAIAAEVLPMFEEEARKRQEATRFGAEGDGGVQKTTTGKARDEAAEMMSVSPASVGRAKRLKANAPEEFERVKAGEKKIATALRDAGIVDVHRSMPHRQPPPDRGQFKIQTERDRQRAYAHKQRLESALSGVAGFCRGLKELDVDKVLAALTTEEVATWAAIAGDCSRDLKVLRNNLTTGDRK